MKHLEGRDREVLQVLADGRSNPYLIRDETGLDKGDTNTVLNRLGRSGYVRQVTRGLYEITDQGVAELREESEPEREDPELRRHETYEQDHWEVIDIEKVDNTFSTGTPERGDHDAVVRVDIDGVIAGSVTNTLGHKGDNVNTSIWLSIPVARELKENIQEAIEQAETKRDEADDVE